MEINTKGMTDAQLESFNEMAGKYEYDAGYTREESERRAFAQLFGIDEDETCDSE